MSELKGCIFDIKRFAVHDGPGIRTTVFFKGCPLSCWWCHNPEGISTESEILNYGYRCMRCGKCVTVCVNDALQKSDDKIIKNHAVCSSCGSCVEVCPTKSHQIIGQKMSVNELFAAVERDVIFYETSSGGVTFSGGEPLMQSDFLIEVLKQCKKNNIHTAVDTSGYAPKDVFNKIMKETDLFLYDLKLIDDVEHRKYAGVSNKNILKNLITLDSLKKPVILRFAILPSITDTDKNLKELFDFISELQSINEISLLPYHDVREKYDRLGQIYQLKSIQSPSNKQINKILLAFEKRGFHVKIGG